jgi:hypothetical protein
MYDVLFWIYLLNATILIVHEIDSAFWKEWKLFKLPGELSGFLLLHIPLVLIVLLGLVWIREEFFSGLIASLMLGFGGIFAFSIHRYFIKKGHHEFTVTISQFLLISTLILSIAQISVTLYLMI